MITFTNILKYVYKRIARPVTTTCRRYKHLFGEELVPRSAAANPSNPTPTVISPFSAICRLLLFWLLWISVCTYSVLFFYCCSFVLNKHLLHIFLFTIRFVTPSRRLLSAGSRTTRSDEQAVLWSFINLNSSV